MNRQQSLEHLQRVPVWDLLVVGGGATGLGVALEAAQRGWRVALLESHDFASGTSSRSTKLLHGGVRYLAQGNLALVREALAERQAVLKIAPHLAQPLPFVMPCYQPWQAPFYGVGLKLYDWLAGRAGLGPTRWLGREQTQAALPGVQALGLRGGIQYWDAQFEDARLALAVARSAKAAGALLLNCVQVQRLEAGTDDNAGANVQGGRLLQVQALDRHGGQRLQLQARCVVNATGVWVDQLRQGLQPEAPPLVQPSQGVHLVVARDFLPGQQALLVPRTQMAGCCLRCRGWGRWCWAAPTRRAPTCRANPSRSRPKSSSSCARRRRRWRGRCAAPTCAASGWACGRWWRRPPPGPAPKRCRANTASWSIPLGW